jgi:hypothetical protein
MVVGKTKGDLTLADVVEQQAIKEISQLSGHCSDKK